MGPQLPFCVRNMIKQEDARRRLRGMCGFKVSATLKIAIFPYLMFQRFQIDMLESFLSKKKLEENIISVERYRW